MAITSANQLELLQTAEAVAREKMIDPDLVIQAMEDSLARAAKSRYGAENDIRCEIDPKTGEAKLTRVLAVVDDEDGDTYRAVYTVRFVGVIYVLHAFQKKSRKGIATPKHEIDVIKARLKLAEAHYRENYGKGEKK